MKKLLLLLTIALLCSCSNVPRVVCDQRNMPESGRTMYIERFEMDNHDYISYTVVYSAYMHDAQTMSVVHDPECQKRDFQNILQELFENFYKKILKIKK